MTTLYNALERFDWYYAYSDDHRVWSAGQAKSKQLRSKLEEVKCPYDMHEIRMTVHVMILEHFDQDDSGQWYRQPRRQGIAGCSRADLITEDRATEIRRWFEDNDCEFSYT